MTRTEQELKKAVREAILDLTRIAKRFGKELSAKEAADTVELLIMFDKDIMVDVQSLKSS